VDILPHLCQALPISRVPGFAKRATSATQMNATSSRSHCIFTIKLHQKDEWMEEMGLFLFFSRYDF